MACVAIASASLGYSGCLLGKSLVPDDVNLVPLVPPAIIESVYPAGSPTAPPGTLTVFDLGTTSSTAQTFAVQVLGGTNVSSDGVYRLAGRYLVDRQFPCTAPTPTDPTNTCGATYPNPPAVVSRVDGVPITVTISAQIGRSYFTDLTHPCHTVDLFISSQFLNADPLDPAGTQPATPGDVAHVRWYIYVQASSASDVGSLAATYCLAPRPPN